RTAASYRSFFSAHVRPAPVRSHRTCRMNHRPSFVLTSTSSATKDARNFARAFSELDKRRWRHTVRLAIHSPPAVPCGRPPHSGGTAMKKWRRRIKPIYVVPLVLAASLVLAATLMLGNSPPQAADNGNGDLPNAFNSSHAKNTFETFLVAQT